MEAKIPRTVRLTAKCQLSWLTATKKHEAAVPKKNSSIDFRRPHKSKIETLIDELKSLYTIAIVTHSMSQAARVSQYTGFFHLGKLIEFNTTDKIFKNPDNKMTQDYITGRFG